MIQELLADKYQLYLTILKTWTKIDRQYLTRSCLSVHGINENKDEDTDELDIKTSKLDMIIDIKLQQVDSMERKSSLKKDYNRKSWPTLVEFIRYNHRHNISSNKNHINGKNNNYPNLNKKRMTKLREAKEQYGFKQGGYWW